MHSRIIELSTEPIKMNERITESDYWDNGFIDNIADYVIDVNEEERISSINWFINYLKSKDLLFTNDKEKIVFGTNVKEKHFRNSFEEFDKSLKGMSFEDFCNRNIYDLMDKIEDKYGFYIHFEGCYYSFDSFVRWFDLDEMEFYFGGILDYHC